MNKLTKIKESVIIFLGGYTREEIKKLYFIGVKEGRESVDSLKFKTNYFNPENVISQYDIIRGK